MERERLEALKNELAKLKQVRKNLVKDIKASPEESDARYDMSCELSILNFRIANIKGELFRDKFGKFFPSTIIDNFIFDDAEKSITEDPRIGGR